MTKRQKQSLIIGALTSSFGIFVSKALGLFYAIPFSSLATAENVAFYSIAYTYYDILLNVCSAGIPFAVATMVAKYYDREDFKTVMLVRKLAMLLLLVTGVVVGVSFALTSAPLSRSILGAEASLEDVTTLSNVFKILSLAIMIVPSLSVIRGFYQGMKELTIYSFSQVLEQLSRVLFLLIVGYLLVRVLNFDPIYAVYAGIFAATFATVISLIYFKRLDHKYLKPIKKSASLQESEPKEVKRLFGELVWFGIPYVLVVLFGNSMNIVNNNFFIQAMGQTNATYEESKLILGMIQFNAAKLTAIPQVLALGFSSGIVPYITVAYENHQFKTLRKNVIEILDTVIYICLPLTFCLAILAKPIYSLLYGNLDLDLGSAVLMHSATLAFVGTIAPICSSLMMTLRMRKKVIIYLIINFIAKFILFFPMIKIMGYTGAIYSSVLSSVINITLCLYTISKTYQVNYKRVFFRFMVLLLALLACNGAYQLLGLVIEFNYASKIILFMQLGIYGVVILLTYFMFSALFKIPQYIFKFKIRGLND